MTKSGILRDLLNRVNEDGSPAIRLPTVHIGLDRGSERSIGALSLAALVMNTGRSNFMMSQLRERDRVHDAVFMDVEFSALEARTLAWMGDITMRRSASITREEVTVPAVHNVNRCKRQRCPDCLTARLTQSKEAKRGRAIPVVVPKKWHGSAQWNRGLKRKIEL